jgi:CheY-like chemotaxis protein
VLGLDRARAGKRVLLGGGLAVAAGVGAGLLIAATADGGPYWSDGLSLGLYLFAATASFALLGLVFAVPRARAEGDETAPGRFLSNSNLEQISDWLTKILVGAGLVQLRALPGALRSLGDYLGEDLTMKNGSRAAVALTVYGAGIGFVFAYLWGRLRLRVLLEQAEKEAEEEARRQIVATSLAAAAATQRTGERASARSIAETAAKATAAVTRSPIQDFPPVLWVDDHPENNVEERRAIETLGIKVHNATSTDQAQALLPKTRYGVIITDLGREEGGVRKDDAGLELIQAVRASDRAIPIAVYGGQRAFDRRDELRSAGADGVFNRATDLLSFVVNALT